MAAVLPLRSGAGRAADGAAVPSPCPTAAGPTRRADWYREGTQTLVETQDALSGYWAGTGPGESEPLIGTSFALLFLSKGRWPVLLAKLQHGDGDDWNHHRSDVANLTRYVESRVAART